jgi:NAD-dependent SIR2 family protein deacetylase
VPAAREAGARLILINLTATDYDGLADVVIAGKAGEVLPRIVAALPGRVS